MNIPCTHDTCNHPRFANAVAHYLGNRGEVSVRETARNFDLPRKSLEGHLHSKHKLFSSQSQQDSGFNQRIVDLCVAGWTLDSTLILLVANQNPLAPVSVVTGKNHTAFLCEATKRFWVTTNK